MWDEWDEARSGGTAPVKLHLFVQARCACCACCPPLAAAAFRRGRLPTAAAGQLCCQPPRLDSLTARSCLAAPPICAAVAEPL